MVIQWLLAVRLLLSLSSALATSLNSRDRQAFGLCFEEDCRSAHFSYNASGCHGPSEWHLVTPCWHECGSTNQSPINIETQNTEYMPQTVLHFVNLCTRVPGKIRNNGHSPHFSTDTRIISLTNVPQRGSDRYIFEEIHFHIGKHETRGSEHSIDGEFYPMEAHVVFFNDKYKGIADAKEKGDGLVVIAIMVEIDDDEDQESTLQTRIPRYETNLNFNKTCPCVGNSDECYRNYCFCRLKKAKLMSTLMEKYFYDVREYIPPKKDEKRDFVHLTEYISPMDVMPHDWSFYMYDGSLTTPPCHRHTRWIIMRCPIRVSREAFEMYRVVQDVHNVPLIKNGLRRPIQKNRLHVYRNFYWSDVGQETDYCPDEH
ncbi:nacrein-like protein [Ostrea edulis]|uniref:nacrein-like protein n=1 Tax=Ostrea edulis TaxID=37623 RepID=UPI0024AEF746|nr:nacrein-like protein [Ostrea edulis]